MSQSVNRYSEIYDGIKAFILADVGQLIGSSKSGGSSTEAYAILHYRSASKKMASYSATEAGLNAALAAASSGDVIFLPAATISGNHTVPDGVSLVGLDRKRCVLTGTITLGLNCLLGEVSVTRSGSNGEVAGVVLSNSGARLAGCIIIATNSGGDAIGVKATPGAAGTVDGCSVEATGSGNGYGYYADGATLTVESGSVSGSTAPMEAV